MDKIQAKTIEFFVEQIKLNVMAGQHTEAESWAMELKTFVNANGGRCGFNFRMHDIELVDGAFIPGGIYGDERIYGHYGQTVMSWPTAEVGEHVVLDGWGFGWESRYEVVANFVSAPTVVSASEPVYQLRFGVFAMMPV